MFVRLLGSGKRAHPCAGVKFLRTMMSFIVWSSGSSYVAESWLLLQTFELHEQFASVVCCLGVLFTVCQLCHVVTVGDEFLLMRYYHPPAGLDKQEYKSQPGENCFFWRVGNA